MQLRIFVLFFAMYGLADALPLYSVIDLGDFPGGADQSQAYALNPAGQVVGQGQNASRRRAFLSATNPDGSIGLIDLGELPGFPSTIARGINARGQIVGGSSDGDKARVFVWNPNSPNETNGSMMELLGLPGERNASSAGSINAYGQIAGFSSARAFLWTPAVANGTSGTAVPLGTLEGDISSFANAMNDFGQVVGTSTGAAGQRAFLWTPSRANGLTGSMIDLGDLAGGSGLSQAFAVNQLGDVVGTSAAGSGQHAFISQTDARSLRDLGDFDGGSETSFALGINSARQVVGYGNGNDGDHAFFWTDADGLVDLNSLIDSGDATWTLRYAQGITDYGQVAGWGEVDPDGAGPLTVATHAFRLQKITEIIANHIFMTIPRPNETKLRFVARTGVRYQIEGAVSLQSDWQPIGDPITGSGGLIAVEQPLSGAHFFYRVAQVN